MKRMINTDIWADARVDGLGSMAKLLWLYILTSPQGNLAGCFELTMRRIEVDTGLKTAQAQKCLEELCAAGLIGCSADTGEVLIVRWRKYNWSGGSPKLEKPLAAAIMSVKEPRFREFLADEYSRTFGKELELDGGGSENRVSDTLSDNSDRSLYLSISNTGTKSVTKPEPTADNVAVNKGDSDSELCREVLSYLNAKVGTSYRPTTEKYAKLVRARSRDGFTLADFKAVIDRKAADWLHDERMSSYLRPETLFGTKFESYLNAPSSKGVDPNVLYAEYAD